MLFVVADILAAFDAYRRELREDDNLLVITLEQTVPYNWNLERTLKPVIYGAVRGEAGE